MFAAVREKLAGAWRRLRAGNLGKLFAFEFAVVLLGVLAAQWIADKAGERRLERDADRAFADAMVYVRTVNEAQYWWAQHGDCIIEQTRTIANAAANGETMTRAAIGPSALPSVSMPTWNEDVRQAANARKGAAMEGIIGYETDTAAMRDAAKAIREYWSTFALLEPSNGQPSEADRAAVRLAAVQAADFVRFLRFLHGNARDKSVLLGI